ncbi:hypothetical protein HPP92_003166 [Vanilla planifolia]|uniref:Pentatricopeptide repeat-containing protein n=1 Tax=Vanilla planifolia TaxID=51239 RepID=A0A835VIP5_VANPL|nr:hypothetical protein HPP92_003166 [Vanilla planifolia]
MAKPSYFHLIRRCLSRNPPYSLPHKPARLPTCVSETIAQSFTVGIRRQFSTSDDLTDLRDRILLLTEKPTVLVNEGELDEIRLKVSSLADDLLTAGHLVDLAEGDDLTDLATFLDSRSAASLLSLSRPGLAFVELLDRLKSRPRLAVQVFLWRLKQADAGLQLVSEEYAKVITLAGRSNKFELAKDLFSDAARRGIRSTAIYNSLMSAYLYNGLSLKAIAVFDELTRDPECNPSIVTYNILLSIYGRLLLIDKLEKVFKQIHEHPNFGPSLNTYNILIAAYLTAWMWDRMENTYEVMKSGHVNPNSFTHCLMLRGYANACYIEKMEKMYDLVKDQVNKSVPSLVRAMICAYCKSSDKDRVSKIEELIKHIPEGDYRPWLNILLIRLYAQEGLIDGMEKLISEAVNRGVRVKALGVMKSIISGYFTCDAIERLIRFVMLAENAGWRLCRSLFHCKMVMFGQLNRMEEMHNVLDEMENFQFFRTKKTFLIMYKAYSKAGRMFEAETIVGMMWKNGFLDTTHALIS